MGASFRDHLIPCQHIHTSATTYGISDLYIEHCGWLYHWLRQKLDCDEAFASRVAASLEDSETFRDDSQVDRRFLSSALTWSGENGATVNFNHE